MPHPQTLPATDRTSRTLELDMSVVLYVILKSCVTRGCKLQALVYDILPSTTAVFSYVIGSRKLSANEQFFVVLKQ